MVKKYGKKNPFYGKHHSEETRKRISKNSPKFWLGKCLPEITKIKMSEKQKGIKNSFFGKKHSDVTRERMRKSHLGKCTGEKSNFWKGGLSCKPYSIDWTETLRRSIRERDKYTCSICGIEPAVHVHHIDYDKNNCNPNNLITLCMSCHIKTNFNRESWKQYFVSKIA